jgi:hypothetical protein
MLGDITCEYDKFCFVAQLTTPYAYYPSDRSCCGSRFIQIFCVSLVIDPVDFLLLGIMACSNRS